VCLLFVTYDALPNDKFCRESGFGWEDHQTLFVAVQSRRCLQLCPLRLPDDPTFQAMTLKKGKTTKQHPALQGWRKLAILIFYLKCHAK
jgi:hypothetical protein